MFAGQRYRNLIESKVCHSFFSFSTIKIGDIGSADITSAQDYYPFGWTMPGRQYDPGEYRYGFQGQEKDDEIKGAGGSLNFKYRVHDPRIGRFLSIDPLAGVYAYNSPYAFSENSTIAFVELEGLEKGFPNYKYYENPKDFSDYGQEIMGQDNVVTPISNYAEVFLNHTEAAGIEMNIKPINPTQGLFNSPQDVQTFGMMMKFAGMGMMFFPPTAAAGFLLMKSGVFIEGAVSTVQFISNIEDDGSYLKAATTAAFALAPSTLFKQMHKMYKKSGTELEGVASHILRVTNEAYFNGVGYSVNEISNRMTPPPPMNVNPMPTLDVPQFDIRIPKDIINTNRKSKRRSGNRHTSISL